MKVRILPNPESVDALSARALLEQLQDRPDSVIGLSTGHTTEPVHSLFVELCHLLSPDLSRVTFFGIDEVANVPREYSGACYTMLKTEVVDPLGLREDQFLMLPSECHDYPSACREFTAEIGRRGGADFIFLGLGENAHLGFNQPGTPFDAPCRLSEMYPELEERIRKETGTPPEKPLGGVTLGPRDILTGRKLFLAAKGASKAPAVRAMLEGPVTESVPASILQLHPDVSILLDAEAASLLTRDYERQ